MARVQGRGLSQSLLLDPQGQLLVKVDGATVTIRQGSDPASALATVYAGETGGATVTQPLTSENGVVVVPGGGDWWLDPGVYWLHAALGGRVLDPLRIEAYSGVDSARLLEPGLASKPYAATRGAKSGQPNPRGIPGLLAWFDATRVGDGLYAFDTFNRTAAAGALGTAASGQVWSQNGNLGIASQAVTGSDARTRAAYRSGGATGIGSIDTGVPDQRVAITVKLAATGTADARVYLRNQDGTHQTYAQLSVASGSRFVQIMQANGGAAASKVFQTISGTQWDEVVNGGTVVFEFEVINGVYTAYLSNAFKGKLPVAITTWTDASDLFNASGICGFGLGDVDSRIYAFSAVGVTPANGATVAAWGEIGRPDAYYAAKQATVANRPTMSTINGVAALAFAAASSQHLLSAAPANGTPFSLVAVIQPTTVAVAQGIVGSTASGLALKIRSTGVLGLVADGVATIADTLDAITTAAQIVEVTYDANGHFCFYINGKPTTPGKVVQALGASTLRIGRAAGAGVPDYYDGKLGELCLFSRVLLGDERKTLLHGLADKWGITLTQRIGRITAFPDRVIAGPVKGVCMMPRAGGVSSDYTTPGGFVGLYGNWDPAYMESCVDYAASLGANAFRFFGNSQPVASGTISIGTYLSHLTDTCAYANSKGLAVMLTCDGLDIIGSVDLAYELDFIAQCVNAVKPYTIWAVESFNEIANSISTKQFSDAMVLVWARAAARTIRETGIGVPITCSSVGHGEGSSSSWTAQAADYRRLKAYDDVVDFHNVHIYDPEIAAHTVSPLATISDKPILVGEYGINDTNSAPVREAWWDAYADLVASNEQVIGGFVWAILDSSTGPNLGVAKWVRPDPAYTPVPTDVAPLFAALPAGVVR